MSIERGLDLLEYMAATNASHTLEHLSEHLGIPRTSCFRVLKVLQARGYVQIAEASGPQKWELTYKLSAFGNMVEKDGKLRAAALPLMKELAQVTDLFVQLGVVSNNKVLYIEDVQRPKLLQVYAPKWSYLEIHACAAGLVLLTHMSKNQVEEIIRQEGMPRKTNSTITDLDELHAVLGEVKKQNYAIDKEYYAPGITCVAAPIFNYQGVCLAAVGVTGSTDEFSDLPVIIREVQECALGVSARLGYENGAV